VVPHMFIGSKVKIYAGMRFHSRIVNRWMVGYKFGEFSWTRKLALYKAKQLKKKKK
jgi:ribosomal protein S19